MRQHVSKFQVFETRGALTRSKEMQFPGCEPLGMRETSCTWLPCDSTSHCKQTLAG
jgi:hypothetical protein